MIVIKIWHCNFKLQSLNSFNNGCKMTANNIALINKRILSLILFESC